MASQKRARRVPARPPIDSQGRVATAQSTSRPAKRTRTTSTAKAKATASAPVSLPAVPAPLNCPPTTVLDVFVFGNGEAGELGLGPDVKEALTPQLNPFLSAASPTAFHVVQLACGGMHTVALTRGNQIVTWGVNDNGALGRDTAWEGKMKEAGGSDDVSDGSDSDDSDDMLNPRESTPTVIHASAFPPGTTFVQVAAGDSFSFALTDAGLVYGWGSFRTSDGRELFLQDPTTHAFVARQSTPARIPGLTGITQIAAGANHVLALEGYGRGRRTRLWAWGCSEQNQLGRRLLARHCPRNREGRVLMASVVPQPVAVADVCLVASGEYHAFAVDVRGRVWAWGLNTFGQTGADRRDIDRRGLMDRMALVAPLEVRALAGQRVVALAAGGYHSAALTADGRCLAWGKLDSGQVGVAMDADAVTDPQRVETDYRGRPRICLRPVEVNLGGQGRVVAAACGTDHTIFITDAGTAFAAGFNGQGQLGLGPDADEEVMVAQRIDGEALQGRTLTWAGAGGQFSMVAGPHKEVVEKTESKSKKRL